MIDFKLINTIWQFLNVMFNIMSIFGLISFSIIIYYWVRGITPPIIRLGYGLSRRKIAIFADKEFNSLKAMLCDSGLIKGKNIIQVFKSDIDKVKSYTFFLVCWKDYEDKLTEILSCKSDSTALIVYAPQEDGRIDDMNMKIINEKRNAIVVNFRGRLLNDIITSLITTNYVRK